MEILPQAVWFGMILVQIGLRAWSSMETVKN